MMNRRSLFAGITGVVAGLLGRQVVQAEPPPVRWRYRRRIDVTNNSNAPLRHSYLTWNIPPDSHYTAGEDLIVLDHMDRPVLQGSFGVDPTTVGFIVDDLKPGEAKTFQILYGKVVTDA